MAGARETRRVPKKPVDPVHEWKGKWWFWDETWTTRLGPYDSEPAARRRMEAYVKKVLG